MIGSRDNHQVFRPPLMSVSGSVTAHVAIPEKPLASNSFLGLGQSAHKLAYPGPEVFKFPTFHSLPPLQVLHMKGASGQSHSKASTNISLVYQEATGSQILVILVQPRQLLFSGAARSNSSQYSSLENSHFNLVN